MLQIEEVIALFQRSPYSELRQVQCRAESGRCVLLGTVPSFYLKQLAQTLLLNQWGRAFPVENRLLVRSGASEGN